MKKIRFLSLMFIMLIVINSGFKTENFISAIDNTLTVENFTDNFDSYEEKVYTDQTNIGNWKAFYGKDTASEVVSIIEDPTGSNRGKVLRLDNQSGGSYLHLAYKPDTFNVRNFTVSYDFYSESSSMGWSGLYVRDDDASLRYPSTFTNILLFEKGKATPLDSVPVDSDYSSFRPGTDTDIYYEYSSYSSMASGSMNKMKDENGLLSTFKRHFKPSGGQISGVWYSAKFEVRDNTYTAYIKGSDESEWRYMGTAFLNDAKKNFYSGGIALGVCLNNYYFDNFSFLSEDGNAITSNVAPLKSSLGTCMAGQSTAGDNTSVKLYAIAEDGYSFDRWYTDADLTNAVDIESIKIQEKILNEAFGVFEWKDVDESLSTWTDLDREINVNGKTRLLKEKYSGKNFRLVITANTGVNGFEFYADFLPLSYNITIWVEGEGGTVSGEGFTKEENESGQNKKLAQLFMGTLTKLTAVPSTGYKFAGWYKRIITNDEAFYVRIGTDEIIDFTVISEHSDIKAVFVKSDTSVVNINITKKILKSDEDQFGEIISGKGNYYNGTKLALVASCYENFSFVGWYLDSYKEDNSTLISEASAYELTVGNSYSNIVAVFEITTYRINIIDGNMKKEKIAEAVYGSKVTLIAEPPIMGYDFIGWTLLNVYDSVQDIENRTITFIVENKKISAIANYAPKSNRVYIAYNNPEYGSALGGSTYQFGQTVNIKPVAKDGFVVLKYTIKGVKGTINEDGSCSFVMPDNEVRVRIEFTPIDTIDLSKEIIVRIVFLLVLLSIITFIIFKKKKIK